MDGRIIAGAGLDVVESKEPISRATKHNVNTLMNGKFPGTQIQVEGEDYHAPSVYIINFLITFAWNLEYHFNIRLIDSIDGTFTVLELVDT